MDLRSERAVALLGEFLDSEDVWIPGPPPSSSRVYGAAREANAMSTSTKTERHRHAEHFAHGES